MIAQITVSEPTLKDLKEFSGETTASKAILHSAVMALSVVDNYKELEQKYFKIKNELDEKNQLIKKLDNACRATLEITGQGDLLT